MIVKCKSCGNEYELGEDDNPEDFQCECGGKLRYSEHLEEKTGEEYFRESFSAGKGYVEEKSLQFKVIIAFGLVLVILGFIGFLFSAIYIIFIVVGLFIVYNGYGKGRSWIVGDIGEKVVAESLDTLPQDYFVFNDVNLPKSQGNIDHVVVGPNGIFVIETKNYRGSFIIQGDDWYFKDGFKERKIHQKPGNQVKRNAAVLRTFLRENGVTARKLWINSVVALKNPDFLVRHTNYYQVIHYSVLPQYILNMEKFITPETVQKTIDLIEPHSVKVSV